MNLSYTATCPNCGGHTIIARTTEVVSSREHPDNGGRPCVDIPLECKDCEWAWDLVIVSPPEGGLIFQDVNY